jgi:hypothetical protein
MYNEIEQYQMQMAQRYVESRRHTIQVQELFIYLFIINKQVDYGTYMDGLAKLIGCWPNWRDYVFSDPKLAFTLAFGAQAAYQYR